MDCHRKKTRVSLQHASGLGEPANGLKSPDSPALSKQKKLQQKDRGPPHRAYDFAWPAESVARSQKEKKKHKSRPPACQRGLKSHLTLQLSQKDPSKNAGLHIERMICMACRERSKVMHSQRKKKQESASIMPTGSKNAGLHIGRMICVACQERHGLSQEKKKAQESASGAPTVWASQQTC